MKKAIITGASSGLGKEITRVLLGKKIEVINLSRSECDLSVENVKTNLVSNENIIKSIEYIKNKHNDFNILILCVGAMHWNEIGKIPINQVDEDFSVNITGAIKLVNGLTEIIKRNCADIVVVGSTSSFSSNGLDSVYVSAKHAVRGFVKAMQTEFKKEDVRVIGFYPGGFNSQFHIKAGSNLNSKDLMNPEDLAGILVKLVELPRNMEVSEIIINRKKSANRNT